MAKSIKLTIARVLVAFEFGGVLFKPNQLVNGEDSLINEYKKTGVLDTDPAAVAYCKEQGAKPVDLESPSAAPAEQTPEQKEALEAATKAVEDAKLALGAAINDDEKATAQDALTAAEEALAKLQG